MDVAISQTTPGVARFNSNLFNLQMNKSTEGPEKETYSSHQALQQKDQDQTQNFLKS